MKKVFRSELLELCKTRTKKSSPNMLKFYVILAGYDMITHAGRATNCRQKFKAARLPTKFTKNAGPSGNMCFNEKTLWRFQTKKRTETKFSTFKKNPWNTRPLHTTVYSDNYCAGFYINSLGHKRLIKTQNFEKKAIFPVKKSFWPIFPGLIEHDKPQKTIYKGLEGLLTGIVKVISLFL